jgi:hypothetical protein
MEHWDEIEEDVSDRIWMLLGTSVHAVLEKHGDLNSLVEEKLVVPFAGWEIVGKSDLLDSDGVLSDWKCTSVWSFILGDKPEYERQLNLYAWMYSQLGFKVNKLQIVAILRDWKKPESLRNNDYPPVPVLIKEIPLWTPKRQEMYLGERVAFHAQTDPSPCAPEERWAKPDTWAVKATGYKRAIRVHNSEQEAKEDLSARIAECEQSKNKKMRLLAKKLTIEYRSGQDVRCENYCNVNQWCEYWQERSL